MHTWILPHVIAKIQWFLETENPVDDLRYAASGIEIKNTNRRKWDYEEFSYILP